MDITDIAVDQVDLPITEGSYDWSGSNSYGAFGSTIVRLETDAGLTDRGKTIDGALMTAYGRMCGSTDSGLGIEPNLDMLGEPVATYGGDV